MNSELILYPLYLFYGMAFLVMGVSITSRDISGSNLKLARPLWLFALFAYTHALLEWFDLYLILMFEELSETAFPLLYATRLSLVFFSFAFLLLFGVRMLRLVFPEQRAILYSIPVFLVIAMLLKGPFWGEDVLNWSMRAVDLRVRYFIGFPGAAISGLGLILYSRTVRHLSRKGALNFIGAGISLSCYSVLTGIIPSGTILPWIDAPIELIRGVSAFIILYFVMKALHTFDIERKLQIEDQLYRFAQSEKLHSLGKLAFGVAHEINNPLGNVSLNVELLKKGLQSEASYPVHERRFEAIERNLDRASKIASELLYFSSNRETNFQSTDLNDVIESTLELLGSRQKSFEVIKNLNNIPDISAVPWKLEEVFLNIISNAMEAQADGGQIKISTTTEHGNIIARISDDGPGISAEHLTNVLDPFFTTKEPGKGTGLGLSICYGIMEMHKGKIEMQSEVGEGTTVILTFPIGVESHG